MRPANLLLCILVVALPPVSSRADSVAVTAVNALGIDLLHHVAKPGENTVFSPYSIQTAMAMTCDGAAGQTRDEMVRVLHYPADEDQVDRSFVALQTNVNGMMKREADAVHASLQFRSREINDAMKRVGKDIDPPLRDELSRWEFRTTNALLNLVTVDRLYGHQSYDFRPAYLKLLNDPWQAPLAAVDFEHDASGVTGQINSWVRDQTHGRITDLVPPGALDQYSRLVIVNAIYLKAPWETAFSADLTQPGSFHLLDGTPVSVPTMHRAPIETALVGYAHRGGYLGSWMGHGFTVITLPYNCPELQFVILLPDRADGLAALESSLTPELLAGCTNLPMGEADLFLPKFRLAPPALSLAKAFQALGMTSAFDQPAGSANFDGVAPRGLNGGIHLTDVFHQAFLQLDEQGTEASAGTGVARGVLGMDTNIPVPIHVDHPFLFAIQQRSTGACLFLGRVTDPR